MRQLLRLLSLLVLSAFYHSLTAVAQSDYAFPEEIKPLILTQWGQHHPFNLLCPKTKDASGKATNMLAGCGPVAMAQMVNYHRHPSMSPDKTYEYDWDLMYPTVTAVLRREEIVAVAKLISDCGVSSLTEYGDKASGTSLSQMMGALKRLFNYSNDMSIYERSMFTSPERDSLFRSLIFTELKAGRPVSYRGYSEKENDGHIFIIDGCRKNKVHVNMGWAGLLRTIDMEDVALAELPDSAFFECTYLSHFVAPRTLSRTGDFAFARCRNLNRIVFHDGLKAVSNGTFSGCTNLIGIKLPKTTTYIGHNAFTSCNTLLSADLPEGIQRVGNYAFSFCKHLYSVNLPKTLTDFGKEVFKECNRLKHVRLDPDNPHFTVSEQGELLPR